VGLLVDAPRPIVYRTMALQAATIVLGFVAGLVGGLPALVLYLAGCGAFAAVIYYVFTDFAVAARASPDGVAALFRRLRSFMIVLWLIYPVIWLLTPTSTGVMDVETTALVVAYLDLVAKVGFGLIALNSQIGRTAPEGQAAAAADARRADV
jgi:sensory rhodopsin